MPSCARMATGKVTCPLLETTALLDIFTSLYLCQKAKQMMM
jgi:hypothetical protein